MIIHVNPTTGDDTTADGTIDLAFETMQAVFDYIISRGLMNWRIRYFEETDNRWIYL
jgi:hypothetical protein